MNHKIIRIFLTGFFMLAVLIIMFLPVPLLAGTVNLPRTGQTKSYAPGDDGAIQAGVTWPTPRFTDNGDGTVTDNLTGLMWLKDGNCFGIKKWQNALDTIADFIPNPGKYNCQGYTASYNDWRLPNVNELESLVNPEDRDLPIWLRTQGFYNVRAEPYWSSTTYAIGTGSAWHVVMRLGTLSNDMRVLGNYHVWPVRLGGLFGSAVISPICKTGQVKSYAPGDDGAIQAGVTWPSPRFTDNGDSTVTDNLTGLMWLKDANCIKTKYPLFDKNGGTTGAGDGQVTWQHALDFVAGINAGRYSNCGAGYNDWRLPNRKELHSLTDFSRSNPALLSGHPFTNMQGGSYWSSTTTGAGLPGYAYLVDMNGGVGSYSKADGNFVWPVRAGGLFGDSVISPVPLTETATIAPISFPGVSGPGRIADSPDVTLTLFTPTPGNIGLTADLKAGKQAVEIFFLMEIPTIGKFFLFLDPKTGEPAADPKETPLVPGKFVIPDIKGLPLFGFLSPLGIPEIPVRDLPKGEYKIVLELKAEGKVVTTSTVTFMVR